MQRKISLFLVGLFLVLSFSIKVQAQDLNLPNYVGHVNDFANIVSDSEQVEMENILSRQMELEMLILIGVLERDKLMLLMLKMDQ